MTQSQSQDPLDYPKAAIGDQRFSSYRFVIAAMLMLINFGFGLSFFVVAPVTPLIIDDYGINRSMASMLIGLVVMLQAGFAIPAGMLIGRVGLKKLITIALLMGALPSLSFLAFSFPVLLSLRVVYGLGFAVIIPAIGPLQMQWFRPKELPLINGMGLAVASLGISLSTFIAAPLSEAIGWKAVLSLFGTVALVGAVFWVVLGRVESPVQSIGGGLSVRDVWRILRDRSTLLMAMADAGPFAQYVALTTWLPSFYHEVYGMSLTKAGSIVGLLSLTGVFTVLVAGIVGMRVRRRRPLLIAPGIIVGFAGLGSFLLADSFGLYPSMVLLGFASWFYLPILFTIPMELPNASPEYVSIVWASIMLIGGIFGFVSPLAVGVLTDTLGTFLPGFVLFAVLSWSLAVAGFLLAETGSRSTEEAGDTTRL